MSQPRFGKGSSPGRFVDVHLGIGFKEDYCRPSHLKARSMPSLAEFRSEMGTYSSAINTKLIINRLLIDCECLTGRYTCC
jgi:hypothetical protein